MPSKAVLKPVPGADPRSGGRGVGRALFHSDVIEDGKYVYDTEPKSAKVEFSWRDTAAVAGKTSYYYVRGEQEDAEVVWASPMWITYK